MVGVKLRVYSTISQYFVISLFARKSNERLGTLLLFKLLRHDTTNVEGVSHLTLAVAIYFQVLILQFIMTDLIKN